MVTNPKTRESRLFRNIFHHMAKSASAIIRSYLMFKPHVVFATMGLSFAILAAIPLLRFLVIWLIGGDTAGMVQSLIFGAIMSVAALLSLALGVLSDLQRTNRVLLEDQLERIKEIQYRDQTLAATLKPEPRVRKDGVAAKSPEPSEAVEEPTDLGAPGRRG